MIMERRSKIVGGPAMNMPDLVIRLATVDDLPAILALYSDLDAAYGSTPDEGGVDDLELWRQVMADTRQQVLVGEQAGEIVGTVNLIIVPNLGHRGKPWAAVENVVVRGERRGQGLGTALMSEASRIARSRGCYKMVLTSNVARQQAHQFYRRLGWQQTHAGFSLASSAMKKVFEAKLPFYSLRSFSQLSPHPCHPRHKGSPNPIPVPASAFHATM